MTVAESKKCLPPAIPLFNTNTIAFLPIFTYTNKN